MLKVAYGGKISPLRAKNRKECVPSVTDGWKYGQCGPVLTAWKYCVKSDENRSPLLAYLTNYCGDGDSVTPADRKASLMSLRQ